MQATTINITDDDLRELGKMSGIEAEGVALRKLVDNAIMLIRRREMTEKFVSGELGVELDGYDEYIAAQEAECRATEQRWRQEEIENHR